MNVPHYIHARALIDAPMIVLISMAGEIVIRRVIVSEDNTRGQDVFLDDRKQGVFLAVLRDNSLDPSFALDHSKDSCLGLRRASKALRSRPESGFVDLNAVSLQLHVLR